MKKTASIRDGPANTLRNRATGPTRKTKSGLDLDLDLDAIATAAPAHNA